MNTDSVSFAINYINLYKSFYQAMECPFHRKKHCFRIISNVNNKTYHVLIDKFSNTYVPFLEANSSCDIPIYCDLLRQLNKILGDRLVLPLVSFIRDSQGQTSVLFEMRLNLFAPPIITHQNLANVFLGYLLFLCYTSYLTEGNIPCINYMKFVYTYTHPILVDIGKMNAEIKSHKRKQSKEKKWLLFMKRTTVTIQIIRYMCNVFPQFFNKKQNKTCRLNPELEFDDYTHLLLCKSDRLSAIQIFSEHVMNTEGHIFQVEAQKLMKLVKEAQS